MKKGKKMTCLIILFCLLVTSTGMYEVEDAQAQPSESAQAAILMDTDSGRVLYEKNSDEVMRIASITKIMTAIIALETSELDEKVVTSDEAFGVEGSSIYLRPGEKLSMEDMLYGLMLRSGNDAAVAIAEHVGGSVEGFSYLMNQKAQELGMHNTVFNNPHGLDTHEEHYSTAKDMALLTAYAMQNEDFARIVSTKKWTAPLVGEDWDRVWYNKNRLLTKYPHADGVKTGYTERAKRTLVSSATKEGHRLLAVTLNDGDDWNDHMNMFEYGFEHYTPVTLAEDGEEIRDERLPKEDGDFVYMNDFRYPLQDDESLSKKLILEEGLDETTEADSIPRPAGYVYYNLDGETVGRTPVEFIQHEEERPSFLKRFFSVIEVLLGVVYG